MTTINPSNPVASTNSNNPPGYVIQTGVSDAAADASNQMIQQSIQSAKKDYTTSNTSAINAIINSYGSSFNLQAPQIQSGGYANAQLNYLLGLPPISSPAASTTAGNTAAQNQNQAAQNGILQSVANYSQGLGTATAGDISEIVSNLPGFQAQLQQGTQAIQNTASGSGLLNSGNTLAALQNLGMTQESSFYNNYINQLAAQGAVGNAASTNVANQNIAQGGALSTLETNYGANMANADLASGQAASQGILSKLSSYDNSYVPTIPSNVQQQNNAQYAANQAAAAAKTQNVYNPGGGLIPGFRITS